MKNSQTTKEGNRQFIKHLIKVILKMVDEPRVMFMDIPSSKTPRSVSPMSPSPGRDRSVGFFDLLTRRFGRRSHDDICYEHHGEEDSRSSSTDSCSSTSGRLSVSKKNRHNSNLELTCSSDSSSNNSADTSNTESRSHRRSTSSLRRAFQSISISSRSLSCSSTTQSKESTKQKKAKKTPPPKRTILRQPVSYTYLKGMSGLPTQRVPRSSVCSHYMHR